MSERVEIMLKELKHNLLFLERHLNSHAQDSIADVLPELKGANEVLSRLYIQHREKLERNPEIFNTLSTVHGHSKQFRAICEAKPSPLQIEETRETSTEPIAAVIEPTSSDSTILDIQFTVNSEEHSKKPTMESRLENASLAAYNKLLSCASSGSPALCKFARSLGPHDDFLTRSMACFEKFLHHETISSLEDVYGVLHVAYAVSQTESETPAKTTPAEFYSGIFTFRELLNDKSSEDPQNPSDRELFDQIVDVMWDELDYAVAWIGKNTSFNWQFMVEMSTKASRLSVAREMLKEGLMSTPVEQHSPSSRLDMRILGIPTDPCRGLEPSFVKEVREWKRWSYKDLVHLNVQQHRSLRTPREMRRGKAERPMWWEIATSSVFFLIVGFLQEVQKTNEIFRYMPQAPYACLLYSNAVTTGECLPQLRDFLEKSWEEGVAPKLESWIRKPPLPSVFEPLIEVALLLVRKSTIQIVHHFGHYLLGMRKIFSCSKNEDISFMIHVLFRLFQCSISLKADWPYRIKTPWEMSNGVGYIFKLLDEISETHVTEYSEVTADQGQESPLTDLTVSSLSTSSSRTDLRSATSSVDNAVSTAGDKTAAKEGDSIPGNTSENSGAIVPPQNDQLNGITPQRWRRRQRRQRVVSLSCTDTDCPQFGHIFSKEGNLRRHNNEFHGTQGPANFECSDCLKAYTREDNLFKHRRKAHGDAKRRRGNQSSRTDGSN